MAETRKFEGALLDLASSNGVRLNRAMRRGKHGSKYSDKNSGGMIGVPDVSVQNFGEYQNRSRHKRR